MHEASLVMSLFDQADKAIAPHAPGAVRLMRVRIGEAAGVEVELFRTAFGALRDERGYATAALEVIDESAEWRCRACESVAPTGGRLVCGSCGGELRMSRGDALYLDRVELEVPSV